MFEAVPLVSTQDLHIANLALRLASALVQHGAANGARIVWERLMPPAIDLVQSGMVGVPLCCRAVVLLCCWTTVLLRCCAAALLCCCAVVLLYCCADLLLR